MKDRSATRGFAGPRASDPSTARWLGDFGVRVECDDARARARVLALWDRLFALQATVDRDSSACAVFSIDRDDNFWSRSLDAQEDHFQLRLLMLLHESGRYGLHANGVADSEAGWLLVGPSGSGKTTLALALRHEGWRHLGDDVIVLREQGAEILAAALRRRVRCSAATIEAFSELHEDLDQPDSRGRGKSGFDVERLCPGSFVAECRPRVLLFPERTVERSSRLVPLDRTSALARLIGQSAGWGAQRESSARHLAALRTLVVQTESYRFLGGADVLARPERVAALLATAVAPC